MGLDFAKHLISLAWDNGIGKKELGFYMAGEPFLYPNLEDVIGFAKDIGYEYVYLTTNGASANKHRLKKAINAGLDSIRFSINATDRTTYEEIHGSDDFQKVVENLDFLREYITKNNVRLATSISCVVTKKTSNIEYAKKLLLPYVDDIFFIPVIFSEEDMHPIVNDEYSLTGYGKIQPEKNFICPCIFNSMYIKSNGEVIVCCQEYLNETGVVANLHNETDFLKIWHSPKMLEYRNIFLSGTTVEGASCNKCILRCGGVNRLIKDEI